MLLHKRDHRSGEHVGRTARLGSLKNRDGFALVERRLGEGGVRKTEHESAQDGMCRKLNRQLFKSHLNPLFFSPTIDYVITPIARLEAGDRPVAPMQAKFILLPRWQRPLVGHFFI